MLTYLADEDLTMPVGQAIEELLLIATVYQPEEFENRIEYLPL